MGARGSKQKTGDKEKISRKWEGKHGVTYDLQKSRALKRKFTSELTAKGMSPRDAKKAANKATQDIMNKDEARIKGVGAKYGAKVKAVKKAMYGAKMKKK